MYNLSFGLTAITAFSISYAFAPSKILKISRKSCITYKNLERKNDQSIDSSFLNQSSLVSLSSRTIVTTKDRSLLYSCSNDAASIKKRLEADNDLHDGEYWFDKGIHSLGNIGFYGGLHAALAPLITKLIDIRAYHGVDIRLKVAKELSKYIDSDKARVLDLCCGVGFSTRALQKAFPDAESIIGVDTSVEMLSMAKFNKHLEHMKSAFQWKHKNMSSKKKTKGLEGSKRSAAVQAKLSTNAVAKFTEGNAENTLYPANSFNLVTIMYGFHETPWKGRQKIAKEVRRLLHSGGVLAVIDLASDYVPSRPMLAGEPYVLEYKKNIHHQLNSLKGFTRARYKSLVPGHVGMWIMNKRQSLIS